MRFYVVQEYLRKDGVIAKPHRAVETLCCSKYSRRWFSTEKSGEHQPCAHKACALYTNIQSREDSTIEQNKIEQVLRSPGFPQKGSYVPL